MCYAEGSIQHATSVCPMCKVFRPSNARCPHKQEVCHNTANHPRCSVVFLKNAEVQTFNGCGFCKWARANPNHKLSGYQNPGWPGCCRPPKDNERIPPADWLAVSLVHSIPIPAEIKTVLDSISTVQRALPATPSASPAKNLSSPPAPPLLERRNSPGTLPTRATISPRAQPLSIPSKSRSNGSPKEPSTPLAAVTTPKGTPLKESPPADATAQRRSVDQRVDSPTTPSPLRRHIELEGTIGRSSDRRSSVSKVAARAGPESIPPSLRRRASTAETHNPVPQSVDRRAIERHNTIGPSRAPPKRSSLDIDFSGLNITQQSSSAPSPLSPGSDGGDSLSLSSGSSSDGTVTSDGGFTDYLSDESEAELQRQAEIRAALHAQNQVEDMEFKAARKQLAHVDLRPPKSWNVGGTSGGPVRTQAQAQTPSVAYNQPLTYGRSQAVDIIGGYSRTR